MLRRNFFAALAAPLFAKFIPDGKSFLKERTHTIFHYVMRVPAWNGTFFDIDDGFGGEVWVPSQTGDMWETVEILKPYGKNISIVEFPNNIYAVVVSNDTLTIKCDMKDMSYVNVSGLYV